MKNVAAQYYTRIHETYSELYEKTSARVKRFAWYRLISFLLIIIPVFIFGWNGWITVLHILLFLVLFLALVRKNLQLEKMKLRYGHMKKIAGDELLALEHQFSHFDGGGEFLDTDHFFSYDLDLFGEGSLFQFINRTATISGKQKLASWLKNPPFQKSEILERQDAVKELAAINDARLDFKADGMQFSETSGMVDEMTRWARFMPELKNPARLKWIIVIIPLLTVAAAIPAILGYNRLPLYLMILVQWGMVLYWSKTVNRFFHFFSQKSQLLGKYMLMIRFTEEHKFNSAWLCNLQRQVSEPHSAGKAFHQLKKLVDQFDYRANLLVAVVLNSFLLWDIRCVYKLWKWHQEHHDKLTVWLDVVAETDAMMSLAGMAYNQSGFVYPEVNDDGFRLAALEMGHPLLNPHKRVSNNLEVNGWSKVLIITGANMAGKSTFLRTVGVNLVLARTGAPVCAGKLIFTPVEIYTNMRTTDSLLKDESYFYAELKRIKGVLDRLQQGHQILVILDEMLKGTNSADKLNGSMKLVEKLLGLQAVALVATHDLKLSEMEQKHPAQVFNKCFEIRIENDELVFDYKLTDGVTQTMNATFLMKKLGII